MSQSKITLTEQQQQLARAAIGRIPGVGFPPAHWTHNPEGLMDALATTTELLQQQFDEVEHLRTELRAMVAERETVRRFFGVTE